jgi:hypothetical protein
MTTQVSSNPSDGIVIAKERIHFSPHGLIVDMRDIGESSDQFSRRNTLSRADARQQLPHPMAVARHRKPLARLKGIHDGSRPITQLPLADRTRLYNIKTHTASVAHGATLGYAHIQTTRDTGPVTLILEA